MYKLLIFLCVILIYFSSCFKFIDLKSYQKDTINVEVKGAVNNPGVFNIKNGSSINDLLKIIDLKQNADISNYNINQILSDNDVINIKEFNNHLISINNASMEELISLPGIGEAIAKKIVEYRNNKLFQNLEELMNIKGISEKKFNKICDLISL